MIDIISDRYIRWKILSGKMKFEDYDDINYKIHAIIYEILIALTIIILSLFFNCFYQIIIISIIFNNLKLFCFGYHFGTFKKCLIVSTIYLIILSLVAKYTSQYVLCISLIPIFLFVFTIKNVPRISIEDKKRSDKFYIKTYIILFLLLIIIDLFCIYINTDILRLTANSINFGIISVELFLTKIGFRIFKYIDLKINM